MPPQQPPSRDDVVTKNNTSEAPFEYRYLTKDSIKALKEFQYNGTDHSLLYKYALSPLAGFLVDHATPSTIAPNSITLIGFFSMVFAYAMIQKECPTFDQCTPDKDVPGYIFLVNGLALLFYQTLDNMDGKHARKTGSSSPLGLFFDHGLDACNTYIGTVNIICMFGIPSSDLVSIFIITTMSSLPFFVTTWEEYYNHKLDLPIVNGPSEGLFGNAVASLATYYFGQQFWHEDSLHQCIMAYLPSSLSDMLPETLSHVNLFCAFLTFMTMREVITKVFYVMRIHGVRTAVNLSPMVFLMGLSALIVHKNPRVFVRHQRLCIYIFGLTFVEMVTTLMLDHMTKSKFVAYRHTLTPLFFLYTLVDSGVSMRYLTLYIAIYASGLSSFLMVKAKVLIQEMCNALGIWCFDIVTPHPNSCQGKKDK